MTRADKKRLEELFSAELLLSRVWLHLQHLETVDLAALMLVTSTYESICLEARRLRRKVSRKR